MTLRRLQNAIVLPMVALDPKLKPRDHVIHAYIYHNPMKTIAEIAEAVRCSKATVLRSIERLVDAEWAAIHIPPGNVRGLVVVPAMPGYAENALVGHFSRRRVSVPFLGEWLMRCSLDDMVYDYNRHDDASPPWLITAEGVNLQLDGWYEDANIAFEFQGPQHFKVSNRFVRTAEELARRQRHDGEKIRLCTLQGVKLIELRPEDLELTRLRSILTGVLPLLPPRQKGPLLREFVGMHNHLMKHMRKYT